MQKDILTSVYERLQKRLFAKANTLLSDEDKARDVLQESFYRLWKRRACITESSHAEGLLITTVRNLSIDLRRRGHTHPTSSLEESLDYSDNTSSENEDQEQTFNTVLRIIDRHLSQRDRDILFKRDRDGWEFSDIAELYGTTEGNVRVIVARARKTVRDIYNGKI